MANSKMEIGPLRRGQISGILHNNGTAAVDNITATMSGLSGDIYLAGGQAATQSLGPLGAGESIGVYWFVGYNCVEAATAAPTVSISSNVGSQSSTINLTIFKAISANAGGLVNSTTLGPGAVVGQTIDYSVTYSFGGASSGDEYFLQPAGNQSFNASCFRLVSSAIGTSIVSAIPSGAINQLYFVATANQGGTNKTVSITYRFQYLCANQSTTSDAYAAQTSGNANIKYTGNYGTTTISYPGATNPFTITKTVSPTSRTFGATASPLTYTVTITNPSAYATYIDRIDDVLPSGVSFATISSGSNVTAALSSSTPSSGATGTISFRGKVGVSYALPANSSISLIYTANAPTAVGSYTNTAQAFIGQARLRNIELGLAATVTVTGRADPGAEVVRVNGQLVPIDPDGTFVTQQLVERSSREVRVSIENRGQSTFATTRDIAVPRNDWFVVGQGDLTFRSMHGSGTAVEVSGDALADCNSLTSRAAFYAKGTFGDGWRLTTSLDTGETLLKDMFSNLDRKDPHQLLRRMGSNEYYTTYGDDSALVEDAPTQGQFYSLLADRSDTGLEPANLFTRSNRSTLTVGARHRFSSALSIYGENKLGMGGAAPSAIRSLGAKFDPIDRLSFSASFENGRIDDATTGLFRRTAATFGVGYTTKQLQLASSVEGRLEKGQGRDQKVWLFRNTGSVAINPDWRALGRFNFAIADDNRTTPRGRLCRGRDRLCLSPGQQRPYQCLVALQLLPGHGANRPGHGGRRDREPKTEEQDRLHRRQL